jgi:hypothetical protein
MQTEKMKQLLENCSESARKLVVAVLGLASYGHTGCPLVFNLQSKAPENHVTFVVVLMIVASVMISLPYFRKWNVKRFSHAHTSEIS